MIHLSFSSRHKRLSFKETLAVNYSLRYTFVSFLIADEAESASGKTKYIDLIESEGGEGCASYAPLVDITLGRNNLSQLDDLFIDESAASQNGRSILRYFTGEERKEREGVT